MNLWLDDVRDPVYYKLIGWTWVKTYEEAIKALATGTVKYASLDHDLSMEATLGHPTLTEKTGYDVCCWMEEHNIWPKGCEVHSMNPSGAARMKQVLARHYKSSGE